jgi:hypothetical protein
MRDIKGLVKNLTKSQSFDQIGKIFQSKFNF